MKTTRTDEVLSKCNQNTSDVDFTDLIKMHELAKDLEKRLEMAKFWMGKVNDYHMPRNQDLSRMAQCLGLISRDEPMP